ncbi:unnamed protein product [Parajaminaea phylloscopi]
MPPRRQQQETGGDASAGAPANAPANPPTGASQGDNNPTVSATQGGVNPAVSAVGTTQGNPNVSTSTSYAELIEIYKVLYPDSPRAEVLEMAKVQLEANNLREDALGPPRPPPRVEFPRDVLKQFDTMPKLHRENWHSWLNDFTATIDAIDNASEIIFGDVGPSHADYDAKLDHRLLGLLRSVCDRTSTNNIRYILDQKTNWSGGRELFAELRDALTKQDGVVRGSLYMELSQVQLPANNDIEKVIHQMQEIRTRATMVGADITDSNLVTHITKLTFHHQVYRTIWESLIVQGLADNWEHVKIAMLTKWRFSQLSPFSRQPRPVAAEAASTSTTTSGTGTTEGRRSRSPEEAYLLGKRDPAKPNEPAKCFGCHQPGHIRKNCPNLKPASNAAAASTEASANSSSAVAEAAVNDH